MNQARFALYTIITKSFGIAATVSVAAYVVLELEYPRLGQVRVDSMDQALVDLRSTMR